MLILPHLLALPAYLEASSSRNLKTVRIPYGTIPDSDHYFPLTKHFCAYSETYQDTLTTYRSLYITDLS